MLVRGTDVAVPVPVPISVPIPISIPISVAISVPISVAVAISVPVAVAISVPIPISVAISVTVTITVSISIPIPITVSISVPVSISISISIAVSISVPVSVTVTVTVTVAVSVAKHGGGAESITALVAPSAICIVVARGGIGIGDITIATRTPQKPHPEHPSPQTHRREYTGMRPRTRCRMVAYAGSSTGEAPNRATNCSYNIANSAASPSTDQRTSRGPWPNEPGCFISVGRSWDSAWATPRAEYAYSTIADRPRGYDTSPSRRRTWIAHGPVGALGDQAPSAMSNHEPNCIARTWPTG